jgi:hypothetical protein
MHKDIKLKDMISVMVMTHIINVESNPYLDNEMIVKTIRSSHDRMNLKDVAYYVYIDSFFKEHYHTYYNIYKENLIKLFGTYLSDINVQIVEDATSTQKGNWIHMISNCNTPYFMFLEHDWEFVKDIPTSIILNEMGRHENFSYLRFSRWPAGHPQELRWDKSNGAMYENELVIGKDIVLPLTKVGLFSGNPHIVKTQKCKDFYMPEILKHFPNIGNRNTYLEKEFFNIIQSDIRIHGKQKSHERWGLFLYGSLPEFEPVIYHLGDWCRKS